MCLNGVYNCTGAGLRLLIHSRMHVLQEKQRRHHAWPSDHHGPDASRQGVQGDAACLAAFCATRSDTAHLAPYFASVAKQPQALSATTDGAYSFDSHDRTTTSQSFVIADDRQALEEGHDVDHAGRHMSAADSWQRQLLEATDELSEKFQALLSLPPQQVMYRGRDYM